MQLEILTPTAKILQKGLASATLTGVNGKFTILKGHTQFYASLNDDLVKIIKIDQSQLVFFVRQALVLVGCNKIIITAEHFLDLSNNSFNKEGFDNCMSECLRNLNLQNKDAIFRGYWQSRLQEYEMIKNHLDKKEI